MALEDTASVRSSKPQDDPRPVLNEVGEQILAALENVSQSAQRALAEGPSGISRDSLVRPSNMMVGDANPERAIHAKNAEERTALRRLLDEPLVARVDVDWSPEGRSLVQTIYFPRRWTGGLSLSGAQFVSSFADLGQLAEYESGETATIVVNGRSRTGRILKRALLTPKRKEGQWDALVSDFGVVPWGDVLRLLGYESLREAVAAIVRHLKGPVPVEDVVGQLMREAADAASQQLRIRRKVLDRIALRDRPILDKFQGQIFRLPLDRQVILFGPPGSGKTTTLIKRLAQKRTPEALTEHESALVAPAQDSFERTDSWAMYSPAELLKQYLGDAFNQEGVPDVGNVRTWEKERHDLARNVLGVLRSPNNSGRFQLESAQDLLIEASSKGTAKLHDEFATYAESNLLRRCNDALESLLKTMDERVRRQVLSFQRTLGNGKNIAIEDVLRLLDHAEGLQDEVKRLGDEVRTELTKIANLLLNAHRKLIEEIMLALPSLRAEEADDEDDEADETIEPVAASHANAKVQALNVLMRALRSWARAVADGRGSTGGQSGRILEMIGGRLPTGAGAPFAEIGNKIATRARLRTLVRAPRSFVLGAPGIYARFRREVLREGRHFKTGEATSEFFAGGRITPDEVDILLLAMLRNARRLLQHDRRRLDLGTGQDWLETIKGRYLMQVFVDEATDLSAVQLGCTAELAHPRLRSWFASGDLRQRITAIGLQDESELQWLNRTAGINIDIRRIGVGYRQSRRLRDLSDALAGLLDPASKTRTDAPREDEEADVLPLLGENLSGDALAHWLADRIYEVERGIGRLPSIALFVDGDDKIEPLLAAAQPLLRERNISMVGYKGGLVVGDPREVRIFDVQHIKGMEFEAVFFVGIDRLGERIPDLFLRFLYVGVTRAATYLGLTCETVLPRRLEPVRSHFSTTSWMDA
jgi:UvrD-like helicase C-terminal domain